MQLPANSDQPGTALVRRNAMLARHPRIVATVWFGGVACFIGCVCSKLAGIDSLVSQLFFYGILAATSAALPASLMGKDLFDSTKIASVEDAIGCGAKIIVASHFMMGFIGTFIAMISGTDEGASVGALCAALKFSVMSLIFLGAITIPVGCLASVLLFRLRDWSTKPKGCAVHGYGMIENTKQARE